VVVEKVVKEAELLQRSLTESIWTAEKPELCAVGEWIELGRTLRGASEREILSLIGTVETHLEEKLEDKTRFLNADQREYVRGYAEAILDAARAELRKRNLKRLG
jgi:hypothetical protein